MYYFIRRKKWKKKLLISVLSAFSIAAVAVPIALNTNKSTKTNGSQEIHPQLKDTKIAAKTTLSEKEVLTSFLSKLYEAIQKREYAFSHYNEAGAYESMIDSQNTLWLFAIENKLDEELLSNEYKDLMTVYTLSDNLVRGYNRMVPVKNRKSDIFNTYLWSIEVSENNLRQALINKIAKLDSSTVVVPVDNTLLIKEAESTNVLINNISSLREQYFKDVTNNSNYEKMMLEIKNLDNQVSNSPAFSSIESLRKALSDLIFLFNNLELSKWASFPSIIESFKSTIVTQETLVHDELNKYRDTL